MTAGALVVVEPGPRSLVVDRGRPGYEHLGLPRGGAADEELHAAALLLVRTPADAASLEFTVSGPTLVCRDAALRVSVAGECRLRLTPLGQDTSEVATWQSFTLWPGDRLRVGSTRGPLRSYLAVGGGFEVTPQLGSRSASLRGGLTDPLNRALRAGDVLSAGDGLSGDDDWKLHPTAELLDGGPIRVCLGPHAEVLAGDRARALEGRAWRVSSRSDRTGIRLDGPALPLQSAPDVPSLGCPPGAIQIGGDGLPMLLGCDRGTTGGYAVIAVVVRADLPRLGRLRPGEEVRFTVVDVDTARRLWRARQGLRDTWPGRLRRTVR